MKINTLHNNGTFLLRSNDSHHSDLIVTEESIGTVTYNKTVNGWGEMDMISTPLADQTFGNFVLNNNNKIYKIPDKLIFLGFMYVIPEYRGKGINKKILDYLIAWGKNKGLNEFQLTVYAQNESAINAYKKSGFSFETITMRLNLE